MKTLLAALLCALFNATALAQGKPDPDGLLTPMEPSLPQRQPAPEMAPVMHGVNGPRPWRVTEEIDPLTDQLTVHARRNADSALFLPFSQVVQPVLTIACWENRTQVYLSFEGRFLDRGQGQVTYRIDEQPARFATWNYDNSGTMIGHFSGRTAIPLAREISGAERLVVRFTPFSHSTWTVEFSLPESEEIIEQVRAACHW